MMVCLNPIGVVHSRGKNWKMIVGTPRSAGSNSINHNSMKNLCSGLRSFRTIGTEYVRAGLLPADDTAKVRTLLKDYLDARVLFYLTADEQKLQQVNAHTAQLQSGLWSVVQTPANAQPTPVMALAVSGMNDVLNSQGYSQAAWWNRIPTGAWCLMFAVAICSNLLVGLSARRTHGGPTRLHVLPLILCIAFLLIADLDSPRRGIIHVVPQNLISLAESLHGH
jgi:hypothetical protein